MHFCPPLSPQLPIFLIFQSDINIIIIVVVLSPLHFLTIRIPRNKPHRLFRTTTNIHFVTLSINVHVIYSALPVNATRSGGTHRKEIQSLHINWGLDVGEESRALTDSLTVLLLTTTSSVKDRLPRTRLTHTHTLIDTAPKENERHSDKHTAAPAFQIVIWKIDDLATERQRLRLQRRRNTTSQHGTKSHHHNLTTAPIQRNSIS